MVDTAPARPKRLRADAARNRELLLEAAKLVFSEGGPDAGLEGVARRAGLGIGTLYRHFPTREALFEAVYRREVEQLSELAEALSAAPDPVDALRRWMHANIAMVATKKGMVAALAVAIDKSSDLFAYSSASLTGAIGLLLDRAVRAGRIRTDLRPEDVLRALIGMCYVNDHPGWRSSASRLADVFVDGMRAGPSEGTDP